MLFLFAMLSSVGFPTAYASGRDLSRVGDMVERHLGISSPTMRSLISRTLAVPTADMQGIFDTLKKTLEEDVESRIIGDHQDTQSAINAAVAIANTSTARTSAAKSSSDADNKDWSECIADETRKLMEYEMALSKLPALKERMDEICEQQEDMIEIEPTLAPFSCDFSNGQACASEIEAFGQRLDSMVASITDRMGEGVKEYVSAKDACRAAKIDYDTRVASVAKLRQEWSARRKSCKSKRATRDTQICTFGSLLQEKCTAVSHYRNLISQVDSKDAGSEFSHLDRVAEWKVTQMVKCLVKKFVGGADMVESDLTRCEAAVNFDKDVGVLDKKEELMAQLSATLSCNSDSETVSFEGGTWEIPPPQNGKVPSSKDYKFNPEFKVQANTKLGSEPFDFC